MTYSKEEQKEYNRKWRAENKEQIRKYKEENKEKIREQNRRYYELNKEKISEYCKLNKEKKAEYDKKYCKLNREKKAECDKAHRKKRKELCLEYLGGKCVVCGTTNRLEFDHIKRDTKKYEITPKLTINFDNLKEELNKCQLLCYDCHKIKTISELTK
jgi:hypothetical protein